MIEFLVIIVLLPLAIISLLLMFWLGYLVRWLLLSGVAGIVGLIILVLGGGLWSVVPFVLAVYCFGRFFGAWSDDKKSTESDKTSSNKE